MRKRTRMRLHYTSNTDKYFWLYYGQTPEQDSAEWHLWSEYFPTRDEAIDAYNERIAI